MTTIQFQYTFDDYVHAQKLHAKRATWSRIISQVYWVVFPLLGALDLLMTIFVIATKGFNGGAILLLAVSLVLLSSPALVTLNWKYAHGRTRSDDDQCAFTFTDEVIRASTPTARSEVRWAAVRAMVENKKIFLFYLAPAKFFPIPKRVCSPAQIDELRDLCRTHIRASVKE